MCSFSTLILLVGFLTCKNRRPYNLYCVGGDVKPCSINQSINQSGVLLLKKGKGEGGEEGEEREGDERRRKGLSPKENSGAATANTCNRGEEIVS